MPRQKKKKQTSEPSTRKRRAQSLLLFSIGVVLLLGLLNLSTGFITDRLLWGFQWLFGKSAGILAALFFFFSFRYIFEFCYQFSKLRVSPSINHCAFWRKPPRFALDKTNVFFFF